MNVLNKLHDVKSKYMKTYNFGLLGAGMIAQHHIQSLQKSGRANVTWVAARRPEAVEKLRNDYAIANATVDYREMLADERLDAVIISTPPSTHLQMFNDVIKAGKHVLLEKPSAMSLKEVDEMIALKNQYPELVVCDASCRHSRLQPMFSFIKKFIEEGHLGEIYFIHHNSVAMQSRPGIEYHPTAKWFLDRNIAGGGPLFDWGVYDLSFHLGILNDAPELKKVNHVFLKSNLDQVDPGTDIYNVEEHFAASLSFSNGLDFYWERGGHANMEVPNETRIYGTRGGLKFQFLSWDQHDVNFYFVENEGRGKAANKTFQVDFSGQDDAFELIQHFLDVMDGKSKPAMPLELSKKHLEIIFKCYEEAN